MQTKDIIKQPLTTEWVVVGRTAYVRKNQVANKQVERNQVEKVTLHSTDTYMATHWVDTDPTHQHFTKTTTDRTKRFLVKDDVGSYRVVPASDFVGFYSEMLPLWTAREAEVAKQQEQRSKRIGIQESAVAQATTIKESYEESVRSSIKNVLGYSGLQGVTPDIRISGKWVEDSSGNDIAYETEVGGTVNLTYSQFMRLMEKISELQDA